MGRWQSDMGCLVNETGRYLAHTAAMMKGRAQLGETNDPLELAVLAAMKEKPSGTIMEPDYSPDIVAGFYRIKKSLKSSFSVPLKGLQEEVKLYIVEGIAPYMPIV